MNQTILSKIKQIKIYTNDEIKDNILATARCDYYGFHCNCEIYYTDKDEIELVKQANMNSVISARGFYKTKKTRWKLSIVDTVLDEPIEHRIRHMIDVIINACYEKYKEEK